MSKATIGLGIASIMFLSSCQIQVMPKSVPVFDFRQGNRSAVNPPRYYACGDVYFPCSYQQKMVLNTEKKHVPSNSVQK